MKKYKLYLFDLDGTLLDSDPMLVETFHYLYKKFKPKDFVIDDKRILTFSGPQIRDTLLKEFPEKDQEMMLEEWRKESGKNYPIFSKPFPGALELLKALVNKGMPTAIITNKHRAASEIVFDVFGINKLNLFSVCADEAGRLKPYPDGIFSAMKHYGVENKDDVIYIGDSIFDYKTAFNAGVNFGFVSWSPRVLPNDCKIDVYIDDFNKMAEEL